MAQFRRIAEHADEPAVIDAIERGASRAEVLRATEQAASDATRAAIAADLAEGREAIRHQPGGGITSPW